MTDQDLKATTEKRDQLLRQIAHDVLVAKLMAITAAALGAVSLIIQMVAA